MENTLLEDTLLKNTLLENKLSESSLSENTLSKNTLKRISFQIRGCPHIMSANFRGFQTPPPPVVSNP